MIEIGNGYVRRSIKHCLFFSGLTAFRQRCVLCISYCTSVTESSAITLGRTSLKGIDHS